MRTIAVNSGQPLGYVLVCCTHPLFSRETFVARHQKLAFCLLKVSHIQFRIIVLQYHFARVNTLCQLIEWLQELAREDNILSCSDK